MGSCDYFNRKDFDIDTVGVEDAVPVGGVGEAGGGGDHGFLAGCEGGFDELIGWVVDAAADEFAAELGEEEIAFGEPEFE